MHRPGRCYSNPFEKVSRPCLVDLCSAFDSIDHDILINRLSSWLGIHGFVLSWLKSFLSPRCFRVKSETDLSSWYTSSCGVPQGSVLGPLLFIMYTTFLSNLISSCSPNHHSVRMRFSSSYPSTHAPDCDTSRPTDYLQNSLTRISSWMTANLLTLNSSKTEFPLIGLSKQLAKIHNSSVNTTHSARNLK